MTSDEQHRQRLLVAALGICATGRQTASSGLAKNARDTIKAQDAEIERLREALWEVINIAGSHGRDEAIRQADRVARAALGKDKE